MTIDHPQAIDVLRETTGPDVRKIYFPSDEPRITNMAGYMVVDHNRPIISLAIRFRIILFNWGWYGLFLS